MEFRLGNDQKGDIGLGRRVVEAPSLDQAVLLGNDIGRPRDARRARNYGMFGDEIILEIAKLEREAHIRVRVRMAAEQLGECFADRRDDSSAMRGADRRAT